MNVHVMHCALMKLSSYLEQNGLSDATFAVAIGVSRSMVTRLRHRQTRPSADTALKIQKATSGGVMLSDLVPVKECDHPRDGAAA
jgi:transcriptional regulator with XRE-family HTH domain